MDLTSLLSSLPPHSPITDEDKAGRRPLEPGTQLRQGDYQLGELIGCGSFGLIYDAQDRRIGQSLAIKEFYPVETTRGEQGSWHISTQSDETDLVVLKSQFEEEYRVLERFERPGIVKVYDLFTENHGTFMVMEQLHGATLEDILQQHQRLNEKLALWFIRCLISTLETIHLSGLIHGDIKPENLFLTHDGQVILLDFGAVNHYLSSDRNAPRFLTRGYAPPEQYQQNRVPDPASDLYAVGATLYEVLTGNSPPDSLERARGAKLPNPNRTGVRVSSETVSALGKTLALAREKRPPSAVALLGLLPKSKISSPVTRGPWSELSPWQAHEHALVRLVISSCGKLLASGDRSGQIRLWSLEQERCVGVIDFEQELLDLCLDKQDRWLAVALSGGRVVLLDFSNGRLLREVRKGTPPVNCIKFSPDGSRLFCGLFDGKLEILNPARPKRAKPLSAHSAPINDIDIAPSGRLLALASNDRSVSIWDLKTQRRIRNFSSHHRPVQVARFLYGGRFLISGGSDMALRVFDVKRGDEFRRLKGHEAMVWDILGFDEDEFLLSCSADKTVRLWDMKKFRETGKFQLSEAWLCTLAFSTFCSTLFIAGVDKQIHRLKFISRSAEFPQWS